MASPIARFAIGQDGIAISGGDVVMGVVSQIDSRREFTPGGFEEIESLDIAVSTDDFISSYNSPPIAYMGKIAEINGEKWRVSGISKGKFFTKIMLVSIEESA